MHVRTAVLCAVTLSASTLSASASASPAFVEASSERDGGKPQSSMWNAVDGNTGTVWCTRPMMAGGKEVLSFTFEEPVVITHLELVLPQSKEAGVTDKTSKRPRVVFVADVDHRVEARFKDVGESQLLELTPPARGKRVVVEFVEPWPGASDDAPLCVAEVTLKNKTKDLTSALGSKARGVNTPARKLLHQWHDEISAPSRTLIFNVDGTFSYRYEPLLDDSKPARFKGKWSATANSVTLDVGGKSYRLETRFTKIDSRDGEAEVLTVAGTAPHESMVGELKPAPMMLP